MDYGALMQLAIAYMGEEQARKMSEKQLRLFEQQLKGVQDVELPELQQAVADQLGESNVGSMKSDQNLRSQQMQALAYIQNMIDRGGLDLTDQASLEEAMNKATNQQKRARAGVAADLQSRGQLNSGANLVMSLDAAQAGANAARQSGTEVAAQAQRRRLEAIREAAGLAGGLREQDWREGEAAARARDIRDERNAAAREKAQYYNLGIPQQTFNNALGKATGTLPSANAYGGAMGAAGANALAAANTAQVAAGNLIQPGAYGGVTRNGGTQPTTYDYNPDLTGDRGGAADISDPDDK